MEEYLLEYILQNAEHELIGGNDFKLLVYLLNKSYQDLWNEEVRATKSELSDNLNVSLPTVTNAIENLEFAGMITSSSEAGRGTKFTINFIEELKKTATFGGDSKKRMQDTIERTLSSSPKFFKTTVFDPAREFKFDENKCKESLLFSTFKHKESLLMWVSNIKNLYDSIVLNIKNLYESDSENIKKLGVLSSDSKESLRFGLPKYKVSLHFLSDAKSLKIKDLTEISDEKYRNIRAFFSRAGSIYNKKYIYLLNAIDIVLFDGKLLQAMEYYSIEEKSKKKSSNYHNREFELNEDTLRLIPVHLHNHKEVILGEEITFIESLRNWLKYKKEDKGQPASYSSMVRSIKWLAGVDNPVECIETSIRSDAKGIFQPSKYKRNKKSGNSGDAPRAKIRNFD